MPHSALAWSIPLMRLGYAGRGMVYLVVAGFSLYAIWRGGQAQGTTSALSQLETTVGGGVVLVLIFLGMLSYAIWRITASAFDLECHGADSKGMVARSWMVVTALLHLSIGVTAFSLLLTGSDGGGSSLARWLSAVMSLPGGRLIIGLFGIAVVTAGLYFFDKGWNQRYRKYLRANHFTRHWNWLLKAGLIAKGAVVAVVGILFLQAAWRADPGQAGGVEKAFSWLTHQPYGWFLVVTICVGLLCFAFYCFVNAAHRTVPKVDGDIGTLAAQLRTKLAT